MDNIFIVEPKELYHVIKIDLSDKSENSLDQAIINYTRGRIDKDNVISIHINPNITVPDFYYGNNIADSMIKILDKYSGTDTLIINMIPVEIRKIDSLHAARIVSIYEYLGFRELKLNENYTIMVYMNSTGIRLFNLTLDRKEYDYGK